MNVHVYFCYRFNMSSWVIEMHFSFELNKDIHACIILWAGMSPPMILLWTAISRPIQCNGKGYPRRSYLSRPMLVLLVGRITSAKNNSIEQYDSVVGGDIPA